MRAYANSGALKTGSVATIYFAARGPYVKIGISRDPAKRLRALRYGRLLTPPDADSSAPAELLHTIPGSSLDDEFRMQIRFSGWHVVGEWFRCDAAFRDELAAVIDEAEQNAA